MSWEFNPETMSTGDDKGLLRRVQIDEAIYLLILAGMTNQLEITRVVSALTGLSTAEVRFNVELAFKPTQERMVDA